MRCILCDRCKSIVEDVRKIKVVTYARPLRQGPVRADDPASNDHIWTKELCPSCAESLEDFMNNTVDAGLGDDSDTEDAGAGDSDEDGDSWTDEVMSE